MNKSYTRDVQVLLKMLANVDSARDVVSRFDVNFNLQSPKAICKNKYAFDLCAFYLAQFGEKVKLLTDSSKSELSKTVDLGVLKYFRNIIDHDYESVNRAILQGYIQLLISNNFRSAIVSRIQYCKQNKR